MTSPASPTPTCPTCEAPVEVTARCHGYPCARDGQFVGEETDNELCTCEPGAAAWRFDAERFLKEKIAALTGRQLLKIASGTQKAGGSMMQWPSKLRAALLDVLLSPGETQ